jgi:protoporphyrinogen/coproporphyrinogen III oxidase
LIGGARAPQLARLEPREIAALADREVRQLLGARAAPALARVRRWKRSPSQPGVDHGARLARIAALQSEHAGLFLTGNYFSGVSTAACVEQAFATARRVCDFLGASRPLRKLVA